MTKDEFRRKLEADIDSAESQLADLATRVDSLADDVKSKYNEEADALKRHIAAGRTRLHEIGEAGDDAWESLRDGAEKAWNEMNSAVRNAIDKFSS